MMDQTSLVNYINPIQTEASPSGSPTSGNNLSSMISALQGNSGGFKPGGMGQNNPWNTMSKGFSQGFGNQPGDNAMYGGYNYNSMAPGTGLSGSELASGAQAGVDSGLTFDPATGTVS